MKCKKCGNEIEEQMEFCTNCGEKNEKFDTAGGRPSKKKMLSIVVGVFVLLSVVAVSAIGVKNSKQPVQKVVYGDGRLETLEAAELIIPPDGEITTTSEEWIYYEEEGALWKIKVDGSNQSKIVDVDTDARMKWEYLEGVKGKTGHIYYIYKKNAFKLNLEDGTKEKISDKSFDTIQYVEDYQSDEKHLVVTHVNHPQVIVINEEGVQDSHNLKSGIIKIIKSGDFLFYSTEATIYKYNMTNSQEKEMVSSKDYIGDESDAENGFLKKIYLIDINGDHIYYSVQSMYDYNDVYGLEIHEINISTLDKNLFYDVGTGMLTYAGNYISGEYLYAAYYPMRNDLVVEQVSLKDGQMKSYGQVLDQDKEWIYKSTYDQILKFNRKTEEEVIIRSTDAISWDNSYDGIAAIKIGDWIYFNEFEVVSDDGHSASESLIHKNLRINVQTGKEEVLGLEQSYYHNRNQLTGENGEVYLLEGKDITRFKDDNIERIGTTATWVNKSAIVSVNKEKKVKLDLPTEPMKIETGDTKALDYTVTPEDAKLYYSSSNDYLASISQDGTLTAYHPGTALISITAVKDGHRRDVKTIQVEVTGDQMIPATLSSQVVMIYPDQVAHIFFDELAGSKLKIVSSDDEVAEIELGKNAITIRGIAKGVTHISLKAEKEGYSPSTYLISVVVIDPLELNIPDLVKGAISHWSAIPKAERNTPMIQDRIVKEGEGIIRSISSETMNIKKGNVILTKSSLEEALKKAQAAKLQIQLQLNEHQIIPAKELDTSLNIDVVSQNKDLIENIILDKKILSDFKEDVKNVDVNIERLGISIGVDLPYLDETFAGNEEIKVLVEKTEEGHEITFYDAEDKEIPQLGEGLRIFIKTSPEDGLDGQDVFSQGIFKTSPGPERQIPVTYDGVKEGLTFKIRESARYEPRSIKSIYTDIDDADPETKRSIENLAKQSIVSDESDLFRANDLITRVEFAQMMVNTFYALDYTATSEFIDVKKDHAYYAHIASSEKEGIVKGFPDNTFKGGDTISKEQLIAIIARSLVEHKGYTRPTDIAPYLIYYKDQASISEWARGEVAFAVKETIIDVPLDGMLEPQEGITRGESAVFINRLFNRLY